MRTALIICFDDVFTIKWHWQDIEDNEGNYAGREVVICKVDGKSATYFDSNYLYVWACEIAEQKRQKVAA